MKIQKLESILKKETEEATRLKAEADENVKAEEAARIAEIRKKF